MMDHPVHRTILRPYGPKGMAMKTAHSKTNGFQQVLERQEAELVQVLRRRDGIAIEKSADQMDEIQLATERDLAIRNVDRESNLLRDVKDALRRIHEGDFGTCLECEAAISPKRLAAVPWAARCIQCQEAADRDRQEGTDSLGATLLHAA
jgi:DnaK suppressor protein